MKQFALIVLFIGTASAQSIGLRGGIFKPEFDLRSKSSTGNFASAFGTFNSAYSDLPFGLGINYWEGKQRISFVELYWVLGYRVIGTSKALSVNVKLEAGLGRYWNAKTFTVDNVAANIALRVLHYGAFVDLGYRYSKVDPDFNIGGANIALGYLIEL